MSKLTDQLSADFKESMRNKDAKRKDIVQLIRAGVLQIEKDEKIEATDQTVLLVVQREVKKRRELISEISDRPEAVSQAEAEIAILETYLPTQLTDDELAQIVQDVISTLGASSLRDMGRVMPEVISRTEGRADNGRISQIVRQKLS